MRLENFNLEGAKYLFSCTIRHPKLALLGVLATITAIVLHKLYRGDFPSKDLPKEKLDLPKEKRFKQVDPRYAKAINQIALDIFENLSKSKNSCLFMPNLIANLMMLYQGMPEEVKGPIKKELHLDEMEEGEIRDGFADWTQQLQSRAEDKGLFSRFQKKPSYQFVASRAIAVHQDCKLPDGMKEANLMDVISFEGAQDAEKKSNAWIENKTDGDIKGLVKDLDSKTAVLLISAAIFAGKWVYPFTKSKTQKESFTNADDTKVLVDKMFMASDNLRFGYANSLRVMELPFHGEITMLIFLPEGVKKEKYINTLNRAMTTTNILKFVQNYENKLKAKASMEIAMPRLNVDEEVDLMEELKDWPVMQMIKEADLNGSLLEREGGDPLKAQKMINATKMKLDEEGVVIKAATYTPCYYESCPPQPFDVNRSFGYVFWDKESKTILGIGKVTHLDGDPVPEKKKTRY